MPIDYCYPEELSFLAKREDTFWVKFLLKGSVPGAKFNYLECAGD